MDVQHLLLVCVPIRQAEEVTLTATAIRGHRRATEEGRLAHAAKAGELIPWLVAEPRRRSGVPATCPGHPTVAVSAPVPPHARCDVFAIAGAARAGFARRGHVVKDDVDDDLHASRPAISDHALEILSGPRSRVQAERDRLVLDPPCGPALVLNDRRHLHRVEAIWAEVLLALPRDVHVVPLKELDEHGCTAILPTSPSSALLIPAEIAKNRSKRIYGLLLLRRRCWCWCRR
mmetsp:Transcript_20252/g.50607  ORF Transcript_20252/g.50607 Transcript_20252/m.50607 type:complete len:232 (-) Transcript_20252:1254-1949(-)